MILDKNGASPAISFNLSGRVSAGEWHHYAASWRQSTSSLRLYLDGNLVNASVLAAWDVNQTPASFSLGHNNIFGGGVEPLNGTIDEFAIYNRQLSDDEVRRLGQTTIEIPV